MKKNTLALAVVLSLSPLATSAAGLRAPALAQAPMSFEPNVGQAPGEADFVARGPGYALALGAGEVTLALDRAGGSEGSARVLRMRLSGSREDARLDGDGPLAGRVNYYRGSDPSLWRAGVGTFARVRAAEIYPGVDVVYYGSGRQLEYDFVVRPGADPSQIAIDFEGHSTLSLGEDGDLQVGVEGGGLELRAPVLYQETEGTRRAVRGRYSLVGPSRVGFEVGPHDPARPLVIDPVVFSFSTYLGGSGRDAGLDMALGPDGSVYLTGVTQSSNFPTLNPIDTLYLNCRVGSPTGPYCPDPFVTRLSADGASLVYSTYLGGNGLDEGITIAVDGSGNAYVAGWTDSTDFPTLNPLQATLGGGEDNFLAKLSPQGTLVYSTYVGGADDERPMAVAVDEAGSAYLTGWTHSENYPTTPGVLEPTSAGNWCNVNTPDYGPCYDAFVTKANAAGSALAFSTFLGASDGAARHNGDDVAYAIAVEPSGAVVVAGRTNAPNFPVTSGVVQGALSPGVCRVTGTGASIYCSDAFVAKLDPAGAGLVHSTYLGGQGSEIAYGLALDSDGNAYVVGSTASSDFPVQAPLQPTRAGTMDAFVAKLDPSATALAFSTYLGGGGTGTEAAVAVAVDPSVNVFVTGTTAAADFPTTNAIQTAQGGGGDGFLAELDPSGATFLLSTYLGGSAYDEGRAVAVDSAGNPVVAGYTSSSDFDAVGGFRNSSGGGTDAFALKLGSVETNPVPVLTVLAPSSTTAGRSDFTLLVRGGGFVPGSIVRWGGADRPTTYVSVGRLAAAISAADVASTGVVDVTVFTPGPGGGLSNALPFTVNPNPVPRLQYLSPRYAYVGQALTLRLTGSGFSLASVVRWNGSPLPTTYVSATELTAVVSAAETASVLAAEVRVYNPSPGGGLTDALVFDVIANPPPAATFLSPAQAAVGGAAFTLYVSGDGFCPASVVRWNGGDLPTTFSSETYLQASVSAALLASSGTAAVQVFNPTPGGGLSEALSFRIGTPPAAPNDNFASATAIPSPPAPPFLDVVSTTTATREATDPTPTCLSWTPYNTVWWRYTATSSGTVVLRTSGSYSHVLSVWTGSPGSFTSVGCDTSAAWVQFAATTGTSYSIMVSSMGSTGGTVTLGAYEVPPNPAPTITSLSPSSVSAGSPEFTLVVRGTGFVDGYTRVGWNGATRYPTVVHPGRLDLSVSSSDIASAGTVQVTAANPAPGGGVSAPAVFTITPALTATYTYLASSPNPSTVGQSVTFTAHVYPSAASGPVTFKDGSTTIGTGTLASGTASFTTSSLAEGVHPITAEYGGDAAYKPSVSSPLSQTVLVGNRAPVLAPIGDRSVDEGATLSFVVSATDADGDALAYTASYLPTGAVFHPATRVFSWTPGYDQAGTYPGIVFTVSDGELSDSESIAITVIDVNAPPVLDPIGDRHVSEGSTLSFTVSATDPDGDPLTYGVVSELPEGATFDAITRVFSWTPDDDQAGSYPGIVFTVSDGEASDSESITITVVDAGFFTVMPCRAVDTREPEGPHGGPALVAGAHRTFPLAGQCGIPATAAAVSVNLTVTQPSAPGNLRLYPAGIPAPLVSTINYSPNQTRANNAIVPLNELGEIAVGCSQASGTVHFILDVNGYFQ